MQNKVWIIATVALATTLAMVGGVLLGMALAWGSGTISAITEVVRGEPLVSEGEFPGTAVGPGYAEWWDGGALCGIVFLGEGETFQYDLYGHYWTLNGLQSARANFKEHKGLFLEKNPRCTVGRPGSLGESHITVPAPNTGKEEPVEVAPATSDFTGCSAHGTIAWQNDNMLSGALYGEAPVGGLTEQNWIVGQTWTDQPSVERWVFAIRPETVVWISGHRGGTAWYFCGDEEEAKANLTTQLAELEDRDGQMKTTVIILPDEANSFKLVTRIQTKAGTTTPSPTEVHPSPAEPPAEVQTLVSEGEFPGEAPATSIVQWWDGGDKCGIFKSEGAFTYGLHGHWWDFVSREAMEERFTTQVEEFLAANPNCVEGGPQ